jgi:hypothetical protein
VFPVIFPVKTNPMNDAFPSLGGRLPQSSTQVPAPKKMAIPTVFMLGVQNPNFFWKLSTHIDTFRLLMLNPKVGPLVMMISSLQKFVNVTRVLIHLHGLLADPPFMAGFPI